MSFTRAVVMRRAKASVSHAEKMARVLIARVLRDHKERTTNVRRVVKTTQVSLQRLPRPRRLRRINRLRNRDSRASVVRAAPVEKAEARAGQTTKA